MLKITTIKKVLFPEGIWAGIPCTLVNLSEKGEDKEMNDVITELLASNLKHILIKGNITENPEIVPMVGGLTNKGKIVTLVTDASDNVEPIRRFKNVRIFLRLEPPTSSENQINPKNLPMLLDNDEVKIIIKDMEGYAKAIEFLKMKMITRPTILFALSDETKDVLEIVDNYLNDTVKFKFKNRISKPISL